MNTRRKPNHSRSLAVLLVGTLSLLPEILCAQALLRNGSFDDGTHKPTGWNALAGGSVSTNGAHHGQRFVSGRSRREGIAWQSDILPLAPQEDFRLEGWLRGMAGKARLGVDLLNDEGLVLGQVETPRVFRDGDWRHVAVEWNSGRATSARVWFRVQGQADLDEVSVARIATSFMGNQGVEADERGRIPFWSEEKIDTLLPGRRAGQHRLDSAVKQEGQTGVELTPSGDWYGFSSVNYPTAPWTERLELSGWGRCDESAAAQLLACWLDDEQKVLRVDASASIQGREWQRLKLIPPAPPARAATVRLVAVARGGKVWFDNFDLLRLRPRLPVVRVFVNQIGYEPGGPKSAVVAANFFPSDTTSVTFQLLAPTGRTVWKQAAPCAGRVHGVKADDWGWYFWRVDFSAFQQRGDYRAIAKVGKASGESFPFGIDRGLLLERTAPGAVDFFFIQRCGFEVPGWHRACHLDDAKLADGTRLDATGGWHSAGDYNKLMYEHGDGGVAYALLSAYGAAPERFISFDRNGDGLSDALDEARWGAEFVAKMQIPESGGLRNHVSQGPGRNWTKWSAPEIHTDNVAGTEDDPVVQAGEGNSPLVIGGWARLSVLLEERGIPNDYLNRAVHLWNYVTKNGTNVGSPYLLLSALELHGTTADSVYLEHARRSAEDLIAQQVNSGPMRGAFGSYGDAHAGALAQFALTQPGHSLSPRIKAALWEYVTFCVSTAENPFGLSKQTVGESERFFPPDLGNNFQWLARAWAAALVFRATGDQRALTYAVDHLDWVLGKNPVNLCMFEGQGSFNPPRYHHRYNMIPGHERGAVPGTIPNGFVRDMGLADRPGFDLSRGGNRSPSFRTSEPWLVHNMFYLLAASALDQAVSKPR